jgi:hypothetical protein
LGDWDLEYGFSLWNAVCGKVLQLSRKLSVFIGLLASAGTVSVGHGTCVMVAAGTFCYIVFTVRSKLSPPLPSIFKGGCDVLLRQRA